MPLTLITGPANAGKTGAVFERLEAAAVENRSAVLLLPTGPDVRRARTEVAERCPAGVEIAQADRYLASRWALYGDGRRLVGRVARGMLMARAIESVEPDTATADGVRRALEAVVRLSTGTESHEAAGGRFPELLAMYRQLLGEAGLVEPTEAQMLLIGRERERADVIVAHRFTDLTVAQEGYLVSAAEAGVDVAVALTWEAGHAGTTALDGLVSRLIAGGASHRCITASESGYSAPDLQELGARVFRPDGRMPVELTAGLTMLEVRGAEAEARAVVGCVGSLLASGISAERIAVVHRDPLRGLVQLQGIFDEAGIAIDVDVPVPVRATAFGRALSRLLAFSETASPIDLSAFLRTPYSGMPADEADRLEREWRRGRTDGRGRLMADVARAQGEAARLLRAAEKGQTAHEPGEAARQWRRALDSMLMNAAGTDAPILTGDAGRDGDVYRAVCEVLQDLVALSRVSTGDLRGMLADVSVQQPAVERPGRVQVMGARRARSRRFDAVVLLGLEGETFPRPGGEGLAGDAVGSLARSFGIRPSAERGIDGERLLFYQVVTRASKELVLIRQAHDEAGNERRASTFWHEVLDVFGSEVAQPSDEPASAHQAWIESLRGTGSPVARSLDDPRIHAALTERETFSASELETYLACPYRWFYQRILHPEEMDRALSPREFGGIAHRALELTYTRLEEAVSERRVTPQNLERVLALADEAMVEALAGRPAPSDLLEIEGARTARARVRGSLRADSLSFPGYTNDAVEWSFGMVDDDPHELDGFGLRGRIDRVDRCDDALIILDYKWSTGASHERFASDGLVQLPLYAHVARERLGGRVAAGLYRGLGAEQDRGFAVKGQVQGTWLKPRAHDWVDAARLDEVIAEAIERAGEAVRGIREGRIEATPATPGACRYCDAGPFCGGCR